MSKTAKIYIGGLVLIILVAIIVEMNKPVEIDWTPTYNEKHNTPYGLEVFHNQLKEIYPEKKVKNIYRTPYEFFNSQYDWDAYKYNISGNFMHISTEAAIDDSSISELFDFAYEGNTIFISSYSFPKFLKDSLKFSTDQNVRIAEGAKLYFYNKNLSKNKLAYRRGMRNVYFDEVDSTTTTSLGYQEFAKDSEFVNFIKINYGSGAFLLHTQPVMFTNFHQLKNDHYKYSEGVLAYIPDSDIYFNSLNKSNNMQSGSKLRFILSQPALKWAWNLGLLTLLIFIIFNAKRKQRIVKIVEPLKNTTLDFTRTIGNLFYETKDHTNVVHKKITYFMESLRSDYLIDTQKLDETFIMRLAAKSGKPKESVEKLVQLIIKLNKKIHHTERDVLAITEAIERFRSK